MIERRSPCGRVAVCVINCRKCHVSGGNRCWFRDRWRGKLLSSVYEGSLRCVRVWSLSLMVMDDDIFDCVSWFGTNCQVREAETEIRKKYPEAAYIELEPDSSTHNMFALEQFQTPALRKVTPRPRDCFSLSLEMATTCGAYCKELSACHYVREG